jgi:hypothetical protein
VEPEEAAVVVEAAVQARRSGLTVARQVSLAQAIPPSLKPLMSFPGRRTPSPSVRKASKAPEGPVVQPLPLARLERPELLELMGLPRHSGLWPVLPGPTEAPEVLPEASAEVVSPEASAGPDLGLSVPVRVDQAEPGHFPGRLPLSLAGLTHRSGSRTQSEPQERLAVARRPMAVAVALPFPASPAMQTRWSGRTVEPEAQPVWPVAQAA